MDDNTQQPMTDDQVTGDQNNAVPADDQAVSVPMSEEVALPVIEGTPEALIASAETAEEVKEETLPKESEEAESFESPAEDVGQPAL